MRLLCTVSVINRALSNLPVNQKSKHVKSTLALCRQPKSEEFCIILFSALNKNGTKYLVKDNITQVLTRFVHEGKATVQFKKPEHNLCIQADVIQLKSFLHLFKRVLENKVSDKDFNISSMAVTALNTKTVAPKKLVILKRSDYPLKGFPRTLEILQINDIRRCALDTGILHLMKLTTLDLSNNLIEFLPEPLNKLPCLKELNMMNNSLGVSAPKKWDWMGGKLSNTLTSLNLNGNGLKYIADQIVRLYSLVNLSVDKNELVMLPSGIGNLRNLQIFSASYNMLSSLPGSCRNWKLSQLDLSNNNFTQPGQMPPMPTMQVLPACTLREYAARKVLFERLAYDSETLPVTVIRYMDSAKYCMCRKACFEHYIKYRKTTFIQAISNYFTISVNSHSDIPIDCSFCSQKCFFTDVSATSRRCIR